MAMLVLPTSSREIDALGLDVDGVLRDTAFSAYEATCLTIRQLGGNPPSTLEDFVRTLPSDYDSFFRACGVRAGEEEFMSLYKRHLEHHDEKPAFADVAPLLARLRILEVSVFAVSGHPEAQLNLWFENHGIRHYFRRVVGGSRNKAVDIENTCTILGVPTARACFVGDWGLDMRAGVDAGVIPIGITRGHPTRRVLTESGATHVIDHLRELVITN